MDKPKVFEHYLSAYGPQVYDGICGEPIMWGFKIFSHLEEEAFRELGKFGELECLYPSWFLITKKLTREDAIKKYGVIMHEEFGPRGGWKSITFGSKTFCSKIFRP